MFLLEEAFQIEMREENLYGLRTVQDVIDAVKQSLEARPAQDLTVQ